MASAWFYRLAAAQIGFLILLAALAPLYIFREHGGALYLRNFEHKFGTTKQEWLREKANGRNAIPPPVAFGSQLVAANADAGGTSHGAKAKAAHKETTHSDKPTFHFVVSSDCSPFQRWQVLTQMHSAIDVGITGRYTWIMSGCPADGVSNVKANKRQNNKSKPHGQDGSLLSRSSVLADVQRNFPHLCGESVMLDTPVDPTQSLSCPSVHFSPDFSDMSIYGGPYADGKKRRFYVNSKNQTKYSDYGNTYYFMNKPSGLKHWSDDDTVTSFDKDANEAIVLIDPDFIFMKKFELPENVTATPGSPAGAHYGLGDQWLTFNLTKICGAASLCAQTTSKVAKEKGLSTGAPYIIHAHDVNALATRWKELVPPIYDEYPLLYAEMYAYSAAAADLDLPHTLTDKLFTGCMVPWPRNSGIETVRPVAERFIDSFDSPSIGDVLLPDEGVRSCFTDDLGQPPLLHYCKRYPFRLNNGTQLVIAKRRVPHDSVDCHGDDDDDDEEEEALLPWQDGDITPSPKGFQRYKEELWNALGVCAIIRGVAFAKKQGCKLEATS